jgi:diguanylate cyclase (GGDEF)-like protein
MTGFPTVNFGESDQGLFSPVEIHQLMRIEYERAVRYGYPFTLMLIEVDRLEYLHDLYGYESKAEILEAVVALLRTITRVSDVLGCMQDDRVMAVFPHLSGESVAPLAGRLLRGCRDLEFESDGRVLRATLSVGVSVSHKHETPDFDRFIETAHEALGYALEAGGDRYVVREAAAAMIEDIRDELTLEASRLRAARPPRARRAIPRRSPTDDCSATRPWPPNPQDRPIHELHSPHPDHRDRRPWRRGARLGE